MKTHNWLITILFSLATAAHGQGPRPQVPESIQAPAAEVVVLLAHATGSQIYACHAGPDGKFGWTLKAPDAELHDIQGTVIGRHYTGPTRTGNEVTGKAAARADAPEAGSVPWLLVTATSHCGSGVLSAVTIIQRIHTKGGITPTAECTAASDGHEEKSSYSADYYFYAPGSM